VTKSIRGVLASTLVVSMLALGACSGAAGAPATSVSASASPSGAAIEVDESLLTVDIRLARTLLDPDATLTDEQIVDAAAGKGITATVEGDTVVYTMTKAHRDEMLTQMRASAQSSADELAADDSNSVTDVEFNEAMTDFKVTVDGSRYSQLESLLVIGFYLQGALYQQFAGTAVDDVDVRVEFVDGATGAVLNTGSYQEWRSKIQGG